MMTEVIPLSLLGENLKSLREKRGWSQRFVANKLNMKQSSTYANWEYGLRDPDTDMLSRLADLYETTTDDLLGRKEPGVEYSLPESVILNVIKEAETEFGVNLRDDPIVESAVRDLLHNLAKMKQGTEKKK